MRKADPIERLLAYAGEHRVAVVIAAAVLIALIGVVDWYVGESMSLGLLHLVPVMMVAPLLQRWQVGVLVVFCTLLFEQFHPLAWQDSAMIRFPVALSGFSLAAVFVSELERSRQQILMHLREVERQTALRLDAEHQMRVLMETSPLGILTLDANAHVTMANQSASEMLGFADESILGADVLPCLPILERLLRSPRSGAELRTTVECKGHRKSGEVFLAHLWLSTYQTGHGAALAAVIWDASENLRDREGTGLDSMMDTSRVLIGAFAHEVRNLAAAAARAQEAGEQQTAGVIVQGLERLAASGLQLAASRTAVVADLGTVLDETRIVIEPAVREAGGTVEWSICSDLPLVRGDHHSLLQVLLNLARNSEDAIALSTVKRVSVEVTKERDLVILRFRDTGRGVTEPDRLFRPFHSGARSAGLGLYVSRAILRAHGGDLRYEPTESGACFLIELWPAEENDEQ